MHFLQIERIFCTEAIILVQEVHNSPNVKFCYIDCNPSSKTLVREHWRWGDSVAVEGSKFVTVVCDTLLTKQTINYLLEQSGALTYRPT